MCDCVKKYYDLEVLKDNRTKLDQLIENTRVQRAFKIRFFVVPSKAFPDFNVVTPDLISELEEEARDHIRQLLEYGREYKTLHWLNSKVQMFNSIKVNYSDFILLQDREKCLGEIERIAKTFFPKRCPNFEFTCLYLLYFYALLVNRNVTWVLLDYLNSGNKYHQYFTEYAP